MSTRALFAVRLSDLKDSTTSPERQLEHCLNLARSRGWDHVGTAEDLDVSASRYSPFNRPELGEWLSNRAHEFDVIVFWRFDRIARSSADLSDLIKWCKKHGKNIVSATEPFDTTDPFGEAMITIIVALAQLEAKTTSLRVRDMHRSLKATDRLPSGVPPFGFVSVPHPSGSGRTYQRDPDMQAVAHDLAGKLLSGWSLTGLVKYVNEQGVLSNRDRVRVEAGKEPKRAPWQIRQIRSLLSSPASQGFKMEGGSYWGKPVLDENGEMIRIAEPLFDDETWEQLQAKVAERTKSGKARVNSPNPILGIGKCGVCGRSLSQNYIQNNKYRYYRCGDSRSRCKGVVITSWKLDDLLEAHFLAAKGDSKVTEKVFVPGTDNRVELENLRASIGRLQRESDMGLIADEEDYFRRLKAMTTRLRELEKEPYRPSRWVDRETDKTYAEVWPDETPEGRRKLLQDANARLFLHPGGRIELEIDYPVTE